MRSPTVVHQSRHWFALALLAVYGAIFLYFDGLRFSPIWDEPNFWRATLSFTDGSVPWLERLRNYGTLNTPLPFLIFAAIESTFHAGLFGRRFFNFIFSLVMVSVIGLSGRSGSRTALATLGLVSFPYFLQFSVLFYTDIIGAFFAFAGVWCYQRRRDRLGCLALVLAIAARQFTLSVAAAIFAHELISTVWSEGFRLRTRWIAPLLACASIICWVALFGGLVTPATLHNPLSPIPNVQRSNFSLDPAAGLFALGCVGLYYVIPEWLLLHRSVAWRQLISVRNGLFALGLLALFLAFPMYHGHGMIRTVVKLTHQPPHITSGLLLFVPACLAVIRFSRLNLGTWLVLAHVAMMMKAFPWENYMVPLLAILWYLASAAPHTIGADFSCGLKSAAEDEPQSPTEIGT